jgi:ubiquinone/menaquinone biosynthesis C-methylase UbiE
MHLKYRSYKKELLDADEVPFDAIKQNLKELNIINTFLGGHQTTIEGLKQLAGSKKKIQVCEIGCGGGDNLEALFKWCKGKSIEAQFTGIDIKQTCIDFAKSKTEVSKTTKWIVSDYKTVAFKNKPDVFF